MYGRIGYQVQKATENSLSSLNNLVEGISNVNSIGYKKSKSSFAEALNGEVVKHETKDFSQGPLRKTAEAYDLALDGPGFFEVELPNGQRAYTRAGRFSLTGEGELVTEEGYRVIPEIEQTGKPIIETNNTQSNELGLNLKIASPKLTVSPELTPEVLEDGTVNGINEATGEKVKIGKINVVAFNNPQGLDSIGRSYYTSTKASGSPLDVKAGADCNTKVRQGFLELGNVNMISDFSNLTEIRNLLSAQFKLLKMLDKIHENVNYTISKAV